MNDVTRKRLFTFLGLSDPRAAAAATTGDAAAAAVPAAAADTTNSVENDLAEVEQPLLNLETKCIYGFFFAQADCLEHVHKWLAHADATDIPMVILFWGKDSLMVGKDSLVVGKDSLVVVKL